jgi:hypothetical protein
VTSHKELSKEIFQTVLLETPQQGQSKGCPAKGSFIAPQRNVASWASTRAAFGAGINGCGINHKCWHFIPTTSAKELQTREIAIAKNGVIFRAE